MSQKLQITFSEEATRKYLERAGRKTHAEVDEDCEPSGCTVSVEIGSSIFGSSAYAAESGEFLEFGEVEVDLVD
jgi:hypothetical protein